MKSTKSITSAIVAAIMANGIDFAYAQTGGGTPAGAGITGNSGNSGNGGITNNVAGRFVGEHGCNAGCEEVVWVELSADYRAQSTLARKTGDPKYQ